MLSLKLYLEGNGCWKDAVGKKVLHIGNESPPIGIALLRGGMQSGASSIAIRLDIDKDIIIVAETSVALFLAAADAIRIKTENERN